MPTLNGKVWVLAFILSERVVDNEPLFVKDCISEGDIFPNTSQMYEGMNRI